ncbi:MAG: indole-3-glycerol phosphate synthase TrpC [Roseovarius sp.]|nr:indole-3-glycerol phosphate synthase TrpC [Roseovarius sp.]
MSTPTILEKIKAYKLEEIASAKSIKPLSVIEEEAKSAPPVRNFGESLNKASREGYGLIAEIKRASPSRGLIRSDFNPGAHAADYERGGACCLSVLTDGPSFQGAPEYIAEARAACGLPVLRKDFMYDPYQVAEARSWGADCILIIMASVGDMQAAELEDSAVKFNMDVLVEVHNEAELERGLSLKSRLVGINNRNLNTFATSLDTTRRISKLVPEDRLMVCESGLAQPGDLHDMAKHGARCFLIGESLMRKNDLAAATKAILANAAG